MRGSFSVLVCVLASLGLNATGSLYKMGHERRAVEIATVRKPKSPSRAAFQMPALQAEFLPTYEANRHYEQMQERTACRYPRPVVVEVQMHYVNSSIEYLPSCTILYRCDRESGCCGRGKVCAALKKGSVDRYFYTIPTDKSQRYGNEVVKLSFTNETLCGCEEDLEPDRVGFATRPKPDSVTNDQDDADPLTDDDFDDEHGCPRCPEPFAQRILDNDQCTCDCFDKDHKCTAIKRGRKAMAPKDARCVRARDCGPPQCSTGTFDSHTGRCPLSEPVKHRHRAQRRHHHYAPQQELE